MPLVMSVYRVRRRMVRTCSRGSVFPERVCMSPGAMSGAGDCPWQLQRHSVHRVSDFLSQGLRGSVEAFPCCTAPLLAALSGDQGVSACRAKKECLPGCAAALSPCCLRMQ